LIIFIFFKSIHPCWC